jgi:hypothetical protein
MFFLGSRRRVPVEPAPQTPPTVPADPEVVVLQDRTRQALRLIHKHLTTQHLMFPDDRDQELCDALLDLRNILQPGVWELPLRPSVPVIPGRES